MSAAHHVRDWFEELNTQPVIAQVLRRHSDAALATLIMSDTEARLTFRQVLSAVKAMRRGYKKAWGKVFGPLCYNPS